LLLRLFRKDTPSSPERQLPEADNAERRFGHSVAKRSALGLWTKFSRRIEVAFRMWRIAFTSACAGFVFVFTHPYWSLPPQLGSWVPFYSSSARHPQSPLWISI
jgi:hypothetical protein